MMPSLLVLVLVASIAIVSWCAWREPQLRDHLAFDTASLGRGGQWYRLLSHGWLHVDGMHLAMNLIVLVLFADGVEAWLGAGGVWVIFIAGVGTGGWLTWHVQRHHPDYTGYGASGGVCAVIFASIVLTPGSEIASWFIPIGIPGWLFGVLYLIGSYVRGRAGHGNECHEGHFGGAFAGLVVAFIWAPRVCLLAPWHFGFVAAVALLGMFWFWRNPLGLPMQSFAASAPRPARKPWKAAQAAKTIAPDVELDSLLEKLAEVGMDGLTEAERVRLRQLSERIARQKNRE